LLGWHAALVARQGRRSFFGVALALVLLTTIGCGWYLTEYQGRRAARELEKDSNADVAGLVAHVTDTLRTADMTAIDLAEYPALAAALTSRTSADLDRANALLDQHQRSMGQSVCYLMSKEGLTIASSNRAARDSFVGKSYAFRPYFTEALAGKPGKYFALGVTSGERGYYTGYPVLDEAGMIFGVVVVKSGVDPLAKAFAKHNEQFLVSPEGVIFMSGSESYLFRTLWPVDAGRRAALLASKQFGAVSFEPLLGREPDGNSYQRLAGRLTYLVRMPISAPGWSVVLLHETTGISIARIQGIGITFVVGVVIMFAFMILLSSENTLQASLKLLELRRRNEEVLNEQLLLQQFISGVSRSLQSTNTLAAVLQQETEIIVGLLGAAFARIWTLNPATNLLELQASSGLYTHLDGAHASIPVGRGKVGQIARDGKPLFTNAVIGDPGVPEQEWARREGMQAFAGYPIMVDGRVIGVLGLFARRTLNESVLEALGLAANLTASYIDRKRAEGALQESEYLLQESQVIASLGSYVLDISGGVWKSSVVLDKVFGIDETYERTIDGWVALLHPDDRSAMDDYMKNEVLGRGRNFDRTYRIIRNDDRSERWVHGLGRLEFDALGRPARMHGTIQDITARKVAEEALQDKTHQLEDLTRNLEQKVAAEIASRSRNEQLLVQQSKMAAMGEMLGAIAHQWRQPLNTLGMCVQNIGDVCAQGDLDRPYIDKTIRKSMDQIRHMSATIDDFRNFFLPDKERSRFDAMAAVGDVLSLLSAQLTANGIGFRLTCHTHGRSFERLGELEVCPEKTIDGFRNEFGHVILNLVINARDAIAARREAARDKAPGTGLITFDFFNRDGTVVIEVGDSGSGISEAIMPRIFEPYFTSKDASKGTGIGLYMSKIMIEDHMKGSLGARNGPAGAVFSITLRQAEGAVVS